MTCPPGAPRLLLLLLLALCALPSPGQRAEEEKPRDLEVSFEGNREISSRSLRRALSAILVEMRRRGIDQGSIEDAAYELERHYRSQGFLRAQVTWQWIHQEPPAVRFLIAEGPRTYLEEIEFQGAASLPPPGDCFPWIRSGFLRLGTKVFTEEALSDGVECVIARYQLEGYFFAAAEPSFEESPSHQVRVRVEITEGPRISVIRPPVFSGLESLTEEEVRKALALELPAIYTPGLPQILKERVRELYRNRGYRFAEVEVEREVDAENREALLRFQVREGPLTRVEAVRISGNETTRDRALEKRIKLRAGDLYREERVRETVRGLLRMGTFSSVNADTTPVEGAPDRVYLDVAVAEKGRIRSGFLLGFGSYEMLRGEVFLEDANLFRMAHRLRVSGRASFKGERFTAEYLNPYFFHERLSQNAQGYYERREHPGFTRENEGGEAGLGYRLGEDVRAGLQYRLRQSNLVEVDPDIPPELVQDVLISSLFLSTVADYRNSIVDPDRGSTHRAAVEYAGSALGSELDFVRLTVSTSWIFPLGARSLLVASARAGVMQPIEDTGVIPIQERFQSGGESTIRSFEEDAAGPRINGEPVGGEAFTLYNLELRFPLLVVESLYGAVFGDVGTLTERVEDFGGDRHFFGVGAGIRYNTPVGPLRFDAAMNPDRRRREDSFELHFGLGYPF